MENVEKRNVFLSINAHQPKEYDTPNFTHTNLINNWYWISFDVKSEHFIFKKYCRFKCGRPLNNAQLQLCVIRINCLSFLHQSTKPVTPAENAFRQKRKTQTSSIHYCDVCPVGRFNAVLSAYSWSKFHFWMSKNGAAARRGRTYSLTLSFFSGISIEQNGTNSHYPIFPLLN